MTTLSTGECLERLVERSRLLVEHAEAALRCYERTDLVGALRELLRWGACAVFVESYKDAVIERFNKAHISGEVQREGQDLDRGR